MHAVLNLRFLVCALISPGFRLKELDVPCLIMHARGDTVTDPQVYCPLPPRFVVLTRGVWYCCRIAGTDIMMGDLVLA